jgi:phosphoglycerate dehydrogenase-like enzyme
VGGPVAGGADAMPREVGECRVVVVGVRGDRRGRRGATDALGARCVGVRRAGPDAPGEAPAGFERVVGADGLDAELAGADVVVLAAPSTPETDGLLGARRIALLGRGRSS